MVGSDAGGENEAPRIRGYAALFDTWSEDVGWFREGELPEATAGAAWWAPTAFAAINGADPPTTFDPPRPHVWRE